MIIEANYSYDDIAQLLRFEIKSLKYGNLQLLCKKIDVSIVAMSGFLNSENPKQYPLIVTKLLELKNLRVEKSLLFKVYATENKEIDFIDLIKPTKI